MTQRRAIRPQRHIPAKPPREVHLGQRVYASFHLNGTFTLRTRREDGDHWVRLPPSVLKAFDDYRQGVDDVLRAYQALDKP